VTFKKPQAQAKFFHSNVTTDDTARPHLPN